MKLKLTQKQVEYLMNKREIYDAETKTKSVRVLVALGLYRDTGDARPFFTLTNKGEAARNALFELEDLGILSGVGE